MLMGGSADVCEDSLRFCGSFQSLNDWTKTASLWCLEPGFYEDVGESCQPVKGRTALPEGTLPSTVLTFFLRLQQRLELCFN